MIFWREKLSNPQGRDKKRAPHSSFHKKSLPFPAGFFNNLQFSSGVSTDPFYQDCFFNRSRISVSRFSSFDGSGGAAGASSSFLFDLSKLDRKSTRLNSRHFPLSYAVFCL